MSETLALLCGVVVIIAAYRAWERPTPRRFVEVGAAVGLATLARAEAIVLDYIGDHRDRLPAVVTARVTRTFALGHIDSQVHFDKFAEGRPLGASWAGVGMFYAVAVGAVAGAVILRRRGVPSFPLTSAVVNVLITAVAFYGSTRFRAPAEPALVLLGAVAVDALVGRLVGRAPAPASPA